MKNVYIDVRYSFSTCKTCGTFNGGNNYAIRAIRLLSHLPECNIHLICDESTRIFVEKLFSKLNIILIGSLDELMVNEKGIFFNPHINDSMKYAYELVKFRRKNPNCKICLTVHDRRHLELGYDKYEGFLKSGVKSISFLLFIGRMLRGYLVDKALKKIINCADQLCTVSNYSMQAIIRMKVGIPIKYYIPRLDKINDDYHRRERRILFLSAGRSEKNFIRSLLSFFQYVVQSGDNVKLIATGLSDNQIIKLHNSKIVPHIFLEKYVEFKGYVGENELDKLYKTCRFLMFTSKNEGYGLPVAEAMMRGIPSLVSEVSSMPEITGSVGVFVNPNSVESICKGIKKLMNDSYYHFLLESIQEKREILLKQIALDEKMFVYDLLHLVE